MRNSGSNRLSPEFALLGFLYEAPGHGYELHRRLVEQFGNTWHVSQSQTYNILKRLEAQGCVRSRVVEQEKLPNRQQLALTDQGRERFHAWLEQPTKASVHAIRVEFITRLYFTQRYCPERTGEMIEAQARVVQQGLFELEQEMGETSDGQTFNRMALELRHDLLNSLAGWLGERNREFGESQAGDDAA